MYISNVSNKEADVIVFFYILLEKVKKIEREIKNEQIHLMV